MGLDTAVSGLFRQTVTMEPFSSVSTDGYNTASYGTAVTYRARVVGRQRMVRDLTGNEKISTVTVYLYGSSGVTPKDRITLPAGFTPTQPQILAVGRFPDAQGNSHEEVYT